MRSNTKVLPRYTGIMIVLIVCLAFDAAYAARGGYHGGSGGHSSYGGFGHGGGGYYHSRGYGDHYYHTGPGAFYWGLPFGYTSIVVGGLPYYWYDGTFYEPYGAGYIVVADPAEVVVAPVATAATASSVTTAPIVAQKDTTAVVQNSAWGSAPPAQPSTAVAKEATINVPNSNGTFTSVKLTRHGNGYLGPQGEFYSGHPTVAQLKALYGD